MSTAELSVMIRVIRYEAEGVLSFELTSVSGQALPDFAPGAHIDVHLPGGLVRQYSLIQASNGRHYVIAVGRDRASRGGSRWLHEQARPGQVLTISAPRNTFPLVTEAAGAVLFAGGIGITPIRAMAHHLQAEGVPWRLYYAARGRASAAFADEFLSFGEAVRLHLDDEAEALLDIAAAVAAAPEGVHLYCCGPEPMIAAFLEAAKDRAPDHVHVEHFGALAPLANDGGLVIELARSGRVIEVAADQTILEAVLAAGVSAPSSCRNGVCGTCETRVLAGVPDHRDLILSEAEKDAGETMMICCSRAKSPRLTLDL
jgi:vanillate O-demethylase ferredoxin subunit